MKYLTRILLLSAVTIWSMSPFVTSGQELRRLSGEGLMTTRPIYVDDQGQGYADLLYVKFNARIVGGEDEGDSLSEGNLLGHGNSEIAHAFRDLRKLHGKFKARKLYPGARWGDTHRVNRRTGESVEVPDFSQIIAIEFEQPVPLEQVASALKSLPQVAWAHGPLDAYTTAVPNDWLYVNGPQWELQNINAEMAWDYARGTGMKIALVDEWDTRVPTVHPDLAGRLVNDFGYYGGHGTWVASVAGAITNNVDNMSSLGWDVTLEGYHFSDDGSIRVAVNEGADVINNSWVTLCSFGCDLLTENVRFALGEGVVVVGAAGNEEWCTSCTKYPAAFNFQINGRRHQVIAVSGTTRDDNFRTGWTYSPGTDPINDPTAGYIDVAAPGDETVSGNDGVWVAYSYHDGSGNHTLVKRAGTSFATPQVSALSALLLSIDGSLTPPEIYTIITQSADKVGQYAYDANGWNRYLGYGRINAGDAVCHVAGACAVATPQNFRIPNGSSMGQHPNLTWERGDSPAEFYRVYRRDPGSPSATLIGTTASTSFTDFGIIIGPKRFDNQRYYQVSAVGFSGRESPLSGSLFLWGDISYSTRPTLAEGPALQSDTPRAAALHASYPNPFNPSTEVRFDLAEAVHVRLMVFDVTGREVARLADQTMTAGSHSVRFDASALPSGVYFCRMVAGSFQATSKMLLAK